MSQMTRKTKVGRRFVTRELLRLGFMVLVHLYEY